MKRRLNIRLRLIASANKFNLPEPRPPHSLPTETSSKQFANRSAPVEANKLSTKLSQLGIRIWVHRMICGRGRPCPWMRRRRGALASDKVRNARRPLPETRIAGRILRRGMGLQADCRKLTRATGLQLVKCCIGSNRWSDSFDLQACRIAAV